MYKLGPPLPELAGSGSVRGVGIPEVAVVHVTLLFW